YVQLYGGRLSPRHRYTHEVFLVQLRAGADITHGEAVARWLPCAGYSIIIFCELNPRALVCSGNIYWINHHAGVAVRILGAAEPQRDRHRGRAGIKLHTNGKSVVSL